MNCVLPVLLVLLGLTFTNQGKSFAETQDTIVVNDQTEQIPHSIDVEPEPNEKNITSTPLPPPTTTTHNGTTNLPTSSTVKPPPTTTLPPKTSSASTSTTSTSPSTTSTSPSTTSPTPNTSSVSPSTSPVTPTKTPKTSTVAPVSTSTANPAPEHHRSFDGPSFIGGIVLALGLVAIGFVAFKFYKARIEVNYHTL